MESRAQAVRAPRTARRGTRARARRGRVPERRGGTHQAPRAGGGTAGRARGRIRDAGRAADTPVVPRGAIRSRWGDREPPVPEGKRGDRAGGPPPTPP